MEWLTLFQGVSESTPLLSFCPATLLSTYGAASGAQEETRGSHHAPEEEGTNVSQLRAGFTPPSGVTWALALTQHKDWLSNLHAEFLQNNTRSEKRLKTKNPFTIPTCQFSPGKKTDPPQDADMIMNMRILEELEQQKKEKRTRILQ